MEKEIAENQQENSKVPKQLQPWQYKKGQSGNPSGRPKGISLKEYAKSKLLHMTDEEREDFFNGLSKDTIWEMAEGKASQGIGQAEDLAPLTLINYADIKPTVSGEELPNTTS